MRKTPFVEKEFYHIYNRGVDKRNIFNDEKDLDRFMRSIDEFNSVDPIRSIYENSFQKKEKDELGRLTSKLVNIVCYCINPNHYHFILEQLVDGGISEFMKRLNGGYTKYFNEKSKRSGALFQGTFKAIHINSNEYLLHLSSYVNLNNRVHQLGRLTSKLCQSSWNEYIGEKTDRDMQQFCNKDIILGQFRNPDEYKKFAESSLIGILKRREKEQEVLDLLLE